LHAAHAMLLEENTQNMQNKPTTIKIAADA